MPATKLQQFGGMLPAWDPHLLPDGQAALSINSYVFTGALQGWREPKLLRAMTNPLAAYAYRIPVTTLNAEGVQVFSNKITAPSTWLEFVDLDTDVVKSQVVDDQYGRYYFASPSTIPAYNTLARIQAGKPAWQLGVPAPACAPEVTVTGGGDNVTLGPQSTNGGQTTVNGNVVYLFPIVPNAALIVEDVQFMPVSTDPNVRFSAVVYADQSEGGLVPTAPGTLVGVGAVMQGITGGTAALSAFANPVNLIANSPYWVGLMMDTSELIATSVDGTDTSVAFVNTFTNGPPETAPAATKGQLDLYMFADLNTQDVVEARSYVYTWVSAYGEEGPPSPFTLVNGWANGVWTVGLYTPPTNEMGNNGIMNLAVLRLYRTVTGTGGTTVYYFVADISLGSSDPDANAFVAQDTGCLPPAAIYVDTQSDQIVSLNIQMPSTNYFPPPANLQGIITLPNGMYAGWVNNEIWFSVPYYPHAWAPGTVYTTDFPILGLGVTGGAIVACTAANAWVINGTIPTQMSMVKTAPPEPCTSHRSMLSTDNGVYYISPNGLIQVTAANVSTNVTELWITREKWAALVPMENTCAIPLASCYFCFGTVNGEDVSVAQQGFNIELDTDSTSFTIWPQPGGHRVGFNEMLAPNGVNVTNLFIDPWTSYGMIIQNGQLYYWDFQDPAPAMMPFDWKSKTFQQNDKKNYQAFRVFFQVPPGCTAVPGLRNQAPPTDPSWNVLGPNQYAIVKVYADMQQNGVNTGQFTLVTAREVQKSGELLRIADGFKAENWIFEILGCVLVSNMQVATSVKELANV